MLSSWITRTGISTKITWQRFRGGRGGGRDSGLIWYLKCDKRSE